MRHLQSITDIRPGMIVLTGGVFYAVTRVDAGTFHGHIWTTGKTWSDGTQSEGFGACTAVHEVTEAPRFFPLAGTDRPCEWLCLADTCTMAPGGKRAESVHRVAGIRLCMGHSPYPVTPANAVRYPVEDAPCGLPWRP